MPRPRDPLGPHDILINRVRDRVHDLITPSTTSTDQWLLRPPWARLRRYTHVAHHASLIDQLRDCFPEGSSAESGGSTGSRPAANLTPIDAFTMISTEASRWVSYGLQQKPSGDVVANLRTLGQWAAIVDPVDDLGELDQSVMRWWAHARLVTTWDLPPLKIYAHCDQCGTRGSLQLRPDPIAAVCFACGSSWDAASIHELGEHVRIMLEHGELVPVVEHDAVAALADLDTLMVPTVLQGTTFAT